MSNTPPDPNLENDDSVIAIDPPQEKRPFVRKVARNKQASRSIRSEQIGEGNSARRPSVIEPNATSVDSDDSSHIPGPKEADAPRKRRLNRIVNGVRPRTRYNQHRRSEHEIQTVSSSSDVEKPNSPRIPRAHTRRARNACADDPYLESRNEVRHHIQDRSMSWNRRSAPERKRRAEHTLRGTAPKRRSSRRVSSGTKDEGLRQVKEDRQRREANQGNKLPIDRKPYKLRERPPPAPKTYCVVEDDDCDIIKTDTTMEEPNRLNNIHSSSDCGDDMNYVPQLEKEYNMAKKGNATATTKPPRDISQTDDVLPVGHEEIAEEVQDLNIDAPYSGPTHLIFEYPRGQKGKIRVTAEERGRLAEKKYLNDSLIDFFFKYQEMALQERVPCLRLTAKFFSSFFFGRLRRTKPIDYEGVRGWTKDVDIFSKQFVFVPICDSYHWSLIIVANLHNLDDVLNKPEAVYDDHKRPRIVYLDSLDPSRGTAFGDSIRRYLVEEWLCRKEHRAPDDGQKKALLQRFKSAIPLLKAKVPLQTNEYDCGLYVLNSLQMFLNNDRHFMDDLLSGEDQVSEAYTHVDIQILRETLVLLMDQFELEWREKTCSLSDEAQAKPTENGNAPYLHEFQQEDSNQLEQETFVQTNQGTQEPTELHERTSDSLVLNSKPEVHAADGVHGDCFVQVNENTATREAHCNGFIGDSEPGKAVSPTGSESENPEMETEIENNSLDHKNVLGSNPRRLAVLVGSASVSDVPLWSAKECDQCEKSSPTKSVFAGQRENGFGDHEEGTEVMKSNTNEECETANHESDNESNQEIQERNVEITVDSTEGFVFKQSPEPIHDHKDDFQNGAQESQGIGEQPLEAVDPCRKSPRISEGMAIGFGGNPHLLRHCYPDSEDVKEMDDDTGELLEVGIELHRENKTKDHQKDGPRLHSPPYQSTPSSETLDTVDHMGLKKTYTRPVTGSASDP